MNGAPKGPAPSREDTGLHDAVPPGWVHSPSGWPQRVPIVVAALVGLGASGWLSLYQEGVVDSVWEPFFGDGTREIVKESGFSRWFGRNLPVGDAFLGAAVYLGDVVTGSLGGPRRWQRMPWLVALFTLFVVVLGVIGVVLVVFQPVLYDSFCTLCIVSAVASLSMIGPALDEVLATLGHLARVRSLGGSLWRAFWGIEGGARPDAAGGPSAGAPPVSRSLRRPLPRLAGIGVGVWLLCAPAALEYGGRAEANDRIVGPVVASLSFVALWELGRPLRWITLVLGGWLILAPVVLWYGDLVPLLSSVLSGLVLLLVAPLGGRRAGEPDPFPGGWAGAVHAR